MNHRTRLIRIDDESNADAREGLARLRQSVAFRDLITVLEQELVEERELYETREASEFQRGQVVMLKKVINLLGTQ